VTKQRVALFGASGTMGFQAFKELWERRDRYDISILVLPAEQKSRLFRPYARAAGVPAIQGPGVAQGQGLTIVWGDATNAADVSETVKGADAVLNAMAYISPMADYHPDMARAVNVGAIAQILRAIEAEPDGAERIRYMHTSTVAMTGNRPVGIHMGRVGDPLKPSVFDYYALTKIAGERLVLESRLRHWVSLRMTFIMPTNTKELLALNDAIMFHMPLDARMENISDRDAGFGLVNCLDIPADSDFWRRSYNMGGGPGMRATGYDFLSDSYQMNGLRFEACAERSWFATRNFHMQYYEDSHVLDSYLHHRRDTWISYQQAVARSRPVGLRLVSYLAPRVRPLRRLAEMITRAAQGQVAEHHRNSPRCWVSQRNSRRISAFFKSTAAHEAIPGWGVDMPNLEPDAPWQRLCHGYDESKESLDLTDLEGAARFRGGRCLSDDWDGDLYTAMDWGCAFGHTFAARPYTVLKAGHWCPDCVATWNGDVQARRNPFFAQVWHADHDIDENNTYPADCFQDMCDADLAWKIWSDRRAKRQWEVWTWPWLRRPGRAPVG
jgi:nucleoside-diphosphate-sugar epimerase